MISVQLPSVQVAFMTTTADKFRQIQLWTQYHRALGVSLFYLFVDGQVCTVNGAIARPPPHPPPRVRGKALASCYQVSARPHHREWTVHAYSDTWSSLA